MDDQKKAVIKANRDFYTAFDKADMDAMRQIWASEHDITVVHPGWSPLFGREDVLSSWKAILDKESSPAIGVAGEHVFINRDTAYVICTEMLEQNELTATNVYVMEQGDWRLVHHQAGLLAHNIDGQSSVH